MRGGGNQHFEDIVGEQSAELDSVMAVAVNGGCEMKTILLLIDELRNRIGELRLFFI